MEPIPVWVVSLLAFIAGGSLSLVRPMPLLVRLSIVVPLIYFGFVFLASGVLDLDAPTRIIFIRIGLVALFIPIITNSLLMRFFWNKGLRV